MLVEERPGRHHDQECECRAAETDAERLVDILSDEADEEGENARGAEEDGADLFDEALACEVLDGGQQVIALGRWVELEGHTISPS